MFVLSFKQTQVTLRSWSMTEGTSISRAPHKLSPLSARRHRMTDVFLDETWATGGVGEIHGGLSPACHPSTWHHLHTANIVISWCRSIGSTYTVSEFWLDSRNCAKTLFDKLKSVKTRQWLHAAGRNHEFSDNSELIVLIIWHSNKSRATTLHIYVCKQLV